MVESLPSAVSTFTVIGRLVKGSADSNDTEQDIDVEAIGGITVTFTPTLDPPIYSVPSASPPVTIYQEPIVATTDSNGFLKIAADSNLGVELVYGFDPSIIPSGWTWDVSIDVGGNFPLQTFSITGSDGGTVDLSSVIPVPAIPGDEIAEWQAIIAEMQGIREDIYDVAEEVAAATGLKTYTSEAELKAAPAGWAMANVTNTTDWPMIEPVNGVGLLPVRVTYQQSEYGQTKALTFWDTYHWQYQWYASGGVTGPLTWEESLRSQGRLITDPYNTMYSDKPYVLVRQDDQTPKDSWKPGFSPDNPPYDGQETVRTVPFYSEDGRLYTKTPPVQPTDVTNRAYVDAAVAGAGLKQYANVAALDTIRTAEIGTLTVANADAAFPYLATMLEPYPATFIIESTLQTYPGFAGYPRVIQTMQMNGTGNKIGFAVRMGFWEEANPGAPTDWENWSFFELPPANITTTPEYLYSANGVFGSTQASTSAFAASQLVKRGTNSEILVSDTPFSGSSAVNKNYADSVGVKIYANFTALNAAATSGWGLVSSGNLGTSTGITALGALDGQFLVEMEAVYTAFPDGFVRQRVFGGPLASGSLVAERTRPITGGIPGTWTAWSQIGPSVASTPNTVVKRNAGGTFQVGAPVTVADVVPKSYVDAAGVTLINPPSGLDAEFGTSKWLRVNIGNAGTDFGIPALGTVQGFLLVKNDEAYTTWTSNRLFQRQTAYVPVSPNIVEITRSRQQATPGVWGAWSAWALVVAGGDKVYATEAEFLAETATRRGKLTSADWGTFSGLTSHMGGYSGEALVETIVGINGSGEVRTQYVTIIQNASGLNYRITRRYGSGAWGAWKMGWRMPSPVDSSDPATKDYVDGLALTKVDFTGLNSVGNSGGKSSAGYVNDPNYNLGTTVGISKYNGWQANDLIFHSYVAVQSDYNAFQVQDVFIPLLDGTVDTIRRSRKQTSYAWGAWSAWAIVAAGDGDGGLVTYTTEAQLNGAIEGELALALIDTEANWPTLWAKIGTPSKVSVRIERYNDGAEVYFTQYLGDSVTRQGYTDAVGVLTWLPWGAIPAIPDEQYGADGYFLRLRKQGSAVFSTWERALSISNAPPTSATAPGKSGDTSYDANYFYICTATNTWKRVAIAAW